MIKQFGIEDAVNSMCEMLKEDGFFDVDEDNIEGCAIREWLANPTFVQYAWLCYARKYHIDNEETYAHMLSERGEAAAFDWMCANIKNREYIDLGIATPGVEVFRRDGCIYVINYLESNEYIFEDSEDESIMDQVRNHAIQQVNKLYTDIGEDNLDLTLEEAEKFIGWDIDAIPDVIKSICEETYVFGVSKNIITQLCVASEVPVSDGELFYRNSP